jgi:hypothetical protein
VPSMGAPRVASPLAERAAATATAAPSAHVLTVTSDPLVPIITLRAVAPGPAAADALLRAAAGALASATRSPRGAPAVVVRPLEPARVTVNLAGGDQRRAIAVLIAIMAFGAWCAAVVIADGVHRLRRRSAAAGAPAGTAW